MTRVICAISLFFINILDITICWTIYALKVHNTMVFSVGYDIFNVSIIFEISYSKFAFFFQVFIGALRSEQVLTFFRFSFTVKISLVLFFTRNCYSKT